MTAHFFLLLNNIPLSACTKVYLSICFYRIFYFILEYNWFKCCVGCRCTAKWISYTYTYIWASLVVQMLKNLPAMNKAPGSIPGLGRSPGGGQGNPLQYSCLENPHGQRSLVGYVEPMGSQGVRHDWATKHPFSDSFLTEVITEFNLLLLKPYFWLPKLLSWLKKLHIDSASHSQVI